MCAGAGNVVKEGASGVQDAFQRGKANIQESIKDVGDKAKSALNINLPEGSSVPSVGERGGRGQGERQEGQGRAGGRLGGRLGGGCGWGGAGLGGRGGVGWCWLGVWDTRNLRVK